MQDKALQKVKEASKELYQQAIQVIIEATNRRVLYAQNKALQKLREESENKLYR